jgi:hypothetical protein
MEAATERIADTLSCSATWALDLTRVMMGDFAMIFGFRR